MDNISKQQIFVSNEILQQCIKLIELLNHCFNFSAILFDAEGRPVYVSNNGGSCPCMNAQQKIEDTLCKSFFDDLVRHCRDIYDDPKIEECNLGNQVLTFPIKISNQFIGVLCFSLYEQYIEFPAQTPGIITLIEGWLNQISLQGKNLGAVVSQLLEFQNRLTLAYRFSKAANGNMNIDSICKEALEVIQVHTNPKEIYIIISPDPQLLNENTYSFIKEDSLTTRPAFYINSDNEILLQVLSGETYVRNIYTNDSVDDQNSYDAFSVLAKPIVIQNDVLGAIIVVGQLNNQSFRADDDKFLTSLASSLGLVLKQIRLAQKLIQAEKEVVSRQEEIVSRVVHKMRNRLVAIQGNLKWIGEIYNNSTTMDLDEIEVALDRTNQNIVDAGKIISGFLKYIQEEECNLEKLAVLPIIEAIKDDLMHASNNKLNILIDCERGLPYIFLDKILFKSAIEEIVINAQAHSSEECLIHIFITTANKDELLTDTTEYAQYIKIDIKDNGPGISDSLKPRIFDLGFSTRSMGNGLGLALVKSDIEKHSGYIHEVGLEGQGAIFRIFLPVYSIRE